MKTLILKSLVGCALPLCMASGGEEGPTWSYGDNGPAKWGSLSDDFRLCSVGKAQSPIDIGPAGAPAALEPLRCDYRAVPLKLVNNGHTIEAAMENGGALTVGGKTFSLVQFHFHAPSEHTVDGVQYPMEAHLVHRAEDGQLAVVGVFMAYMDGRSNPLINLVWRHLPERPEETVANASTVNAMDLLPSDRAHVRYDGSLTTPPCSEDVLWHVMRRPIPVTPEQVETFRRVIGENSRPVQPLNGRVLKEAAQ